jgi:transcriptional regulator with XRE-family HTH domain
MKFWEDFRLMNFGERLWKRRKDLDLSREALAARAKTSPQTLWKYEKGLTEPDVSTLLLLARALNCSVASLFGESLIGDDLDSTAILEAVCLLRERGDITLEDVIRAGLTPEKQLKVRRRR